MPTKPHFITVYMILNLFQTHILNDLNTETYKNSSTYNKDVFTENLLNNENHINTGEQILLKN